MPYKFEYKKKKIANKDDKRIKLTDKHKEEIIKKYSLGMSKRALGREYKVSPKTINFVINPELYQLQLQRYKEEKHYKKYYDKEKHKNYTKAHRKYKQNLNLQNKLIGG